MKKKTFLIIFLIILPPSIISSFFSEADLNNQVSIIVIWLAYFAEKYEWKAFFFFAMQIRGLRIVVGEKENRL